MNPVRPRRLLALLPWCAGLALAQQPAPAPTADAMERARRDAANPMRVILEAGRLPPRRRVEAAPAAAPAPDPVRRETVQAVPEPAPALPPAAAPVAEAPAVVAAPVEPAVPPPVDPQPAAVPAPPVVEPPPAPLTATAWDEPTIEPTLLNLVEPAIPAAVLGRIGALREVTADLSLRADGSVASVALAPATPRAAARYLTQAFEQWRFAPLPSARLHRVQLVFSD